MSFELNDYQEIAMTTAIYDDKIIYPALKLAGEAGEACEKIGKHLRDHGGLKNLENMDEEYKMGVIKEIGDVMWYCAALSRDLGVRLEDVASANVAKLLKRKEEGKLQGSGDNR